MSDVLLGSATGFFWRLSGKSAMNRQLRKSANVAQKKYNTGLFMMFHNIQKCLNKQKREAKKIRIKYIMQRKHEVYPIKVPKK